jgi:hypothetical protein
LTPEQEARAVQLESEMSQLAARNAWAGVEKAYLERVSLGGELPPDVRQLGADSARALGDPWTSYQRLLPVIAAQPDNEVAHRQMAELRERYGRVTVRRVELTPIELSVAVVPFLPDERSCVDFAIGVLHETGGFDGLLPLGGYRLGDHAFTVIAGLDPVIVQRTIGDGTPKRRQKDAED